MILEIVSTGEEVLSGQIIDTNAAWISSQLSENGIEIAKRFTVGDRLHDLVDCFRERSALADLIIVTGGLGPTSDDLSSRAMAEAKSEAWRLFPEWWDELQRRFKLYGRPLDPQNIQQATLPDSATILDNQIGTACGFKVKLGRATFYFLPGIPAEMKKMFLGSVLPEILSLRKPEKIKVQLFQTFGCAESTLGRVLSKIELPKTITLGYRPRIPTVEIKLIARGATESEREKAAQEIRNCLGDKLYSERDQSIASKVHDLMLEGKVRLATAESCTGGMLSPQLVDQAGSSAYFDRGYVCYSNRSKTELLGIARELIDEKGAVSIEVAEAMAKNARRLAGTDFALSITGVAGPDGGTLEKPVGTVAFALASASEIVGQQLVVPPWGRKRIREVSSAIALDMLRRSLLGLEICGAYDLAKTSK